MRFAITASDQYLGVFDAFVKAGWRPLKLFLPISTGDMVNQRGVIAYAEKLSVPTQLSKMTEADIELLARDECDAIVVASYPWKIPQWEPHIKYAVNFHPSPLPEGRGPQPTLHAILEQRKDWAVTCHRLASSFDTGDIIASEIFSLDHDECRESLDLKVALASRDLAARIARNFIALWDNAQPQTGGSYHRATKIRDHVVQFKQSVDDISRHVRAHGSGEALAKIGGSYFRIKKAVGWKAAHNIPPGTVVHTMGKTLVITTNDGYIGMVDYEGPLPSLPGLG